MKSTRLAVPGLHMGGAVAPEADIAAQHLLLSFNRLEHWLATNHYRGYEPFDGLSTFLRPLAVTKPARQALVQIGVRAPFSVRPLLGIRPHTSTKGAGYIARAYLKRFQTTTDPAYLEQARHWLDWLQQNASPNQPGMAWGNHFDYQTRGYYLARGGPTVVWTALIGHAFIEAYEALGQEAYLEVARQAGHFIVEGLERKREGRGVCISYVPGTYLPIHNANMLAAGFLARVYGHTGERAMGEVAAAAVTYTVDAQRPDGSWWYAQAPEFRWVDNWHTAYVLDSLWWYMQATHDWAYHNAFRDGVRYWLDHFFLDDGTPRYYAQRTFPIDIQAAAQSIESLCLYAHAYDPTCLDLAWKVALWTIKHMQDPDGHFYYRRGSWWLNKTPMLHWGQATMLYALVCLLCPSSSKCHAERSETSRTGQ